MKRIAVAFLFLMFGVTVFAQDKTTYTSDKPATTEAKTEIKFETMDHDFGKIREGTMAMYEFRFTNTGKMPLVLSDVHPSCGCTTPEWPREPIAPGATARVKAVFNSFGRPGNFEKYITVKSNTSTPELTLKFHGVVEAVPVEPQSPVRNQGME